MNVNIDFNSIANACLKDVYDNVTFDDVENIVSDELMNIEDNIETLTDTSSSYDFKENAIQMLKAALIICAVKKIDLNKYFNISLNLNND